MTAERASNTDRIEKKILLHAPLERVWAAISDSAQFGKWFGVAVDGPFVAGSRSPARIVPTTVDPEVAKMQKPHEGARFDFHVERIEPMHTFSFRWHPYGIDPEVDVSKEPMTLVVFELRAVAQATELSISESGFDRIPMERRAKAFAANDAGWSHQAQLIKKYLEMQPRF
jgi:uncharacterized protein YndB with AHSA1/START domain